MAGDCGLAQDVNARLRRTLTDFFLLHLWWLLLNRPITVYTDGIWVFSDFESGKRCCAR